MGPGKNKECAVKAHDHVLITSHPAMANASSFVPTSRVCHRPRVAIVMYSWSAREVKCQWGCMWKSVLFRTMQKKPSTPTRWLRPIN